MKYIELTLDNAQILDAICNAALKVEGMQILPLVNQLAAMIKDSENV